jgi:uncharacterized protein
MSVYLDASVLVALFTNDRHSNRAGAFLKTQKPVLVVSDFAAAEVASVVARRVRTTDLTADEARAAFSAFDAWTARAAQRTTTGAADVIAAAAFLRRLDLNLRTPDALHIAIAQRIGASLATFDEKMAANAGILGTPVVAA